MQKRSLADSNIPLLIIFVKDHKSAPFKTKQLLPKIFQILNPLINRIKSKTILLIKLR